MEKSKKILNSAKRLAAFFYKDFHWKLLSLFLAFMLWFLGVNINDPVVFQGFPNLPLVVMGRDQLVYHNAVLLNEAQVNGTRVAVEVRGIRSNLELIQANRAENIQASIDLSKIDFEEVFENSDGIVHLPLDIDIFINQEYISLEMDQSQVTLTLDRYGDRSMPIRIETLGEPREGYEQREPILGQSMVRLTGARSALNEVARVEARINIDDAYATVEEMLPLVVYNSEGQIITGTVSLSTQLIHVRVPILPHSAMPLAVTEVGNVLPGFAVADIIIDPPTIDLVGTADENTTQIMLGNIDLSLAEETIIKTFDIRSALVGTGLSLRAGAPTEATVTVVVERLISRDFVLPLNSLSVSGVTRPYSFANQGPLRLTFRGRESIINAMNLNQISAGINLGPVGTGTHNVPVSVSAPPGATLVNAVTVSVVIEPEATVTEPYEPTPPYEPDDPMDYPPINGNGEDNGYEEDPGDNGDDYEDNEEEE